MNKKLVSAAMGSAMLLSVLGTGMTAFAEEEISGELNLVHYLTEDAKLQALDDLIAGFEEEYPGVDVIPESTTMDNYTDIVKLKVSTDEAPDIIFGSPKTYSDLVEGGVIADLSDEDFVSRVSASGQVNVSIDGKVYGIPLDQMANVVFYNRDIFEELGLEVPTTFDEFISTLQTLTDNGYVGAAAGYQDAISLGANIYTIFFGAPYLDGAEFYASELMSGEKSTHDYPSLAKSMEEWRQIMAYQNEDQKTIDTDRAEQLFANGEAGMIIIGTWGLGAIMNYNPEGNFGGFMFPSEDTAEANAIPVATDDTWMVAQDSENKEAALAFCEYMTRPEVNAKWCATTSQLSALEGVTVDTLPQAAQDIAEVIANSTVSSWLENGAMVGQYESAWYDTLQEFALTDDMTVDEFCDILDAECEAAKK